jgi:hypothetical protein
MAQDLTWGIISKWNAFVVDRDGVKLSKEKFNLRNEHKRQWSGFNRKAFDIQAAKDGKGVTLSLKVRD